MSHTQWIRTAFELARRTSVWFLNVKSVRRLLMTMNRVRPRFVPPCHSLPVAERRPKSVQVSTD